MCCDVAFCLCSYYETLDGLVGGIELSLEFTRIILTLQRKKSWLFFYHLIQWPAFDQTDTDTALERR